MTAVVCIFSDTLSPPLACDLLAFPPFIFGPSSSPESSNTFGTANLNFTFKLFWSFFAASELVPAVLLAALPQKAYTSVLRNVFLGKSCVLAAVISLIICKHVYHPPSEVLFS